MGFHWDVFAKVNAMVCVFGLITYALANHADSVTLKPDGRADDSWGAYLTQFLWSYLGAMIRNGCLVAAMTILTRNQTPLRVIDHALESSSSITTDAADAAGYNAPLVASRTDSVHGTDAKTAAKCAPAAVPAPTSSAAAIGASDAAPKRKAASLKQRPVPTVRENIEMSLRMLLIACSFEALAALIAEHGRGFASYPSPFEGGAAELGSTLAAISGAVVSGDLHSAVRVASASWWWPVVTYVPHLFMFEVVFDLGHYVVHRLCHDVSWLYRHAHKLHHKYPHPTPLGTYMQDPIDVVFSNIFPVLLALWTVPQFTCLQFHLLLAYKTFVEIAGHTGKFSRATSFPICPPLPQFFGVALVTADHELHHTHSKYNFSKRFILWDRLFGTYRLPPQRHIPVEGYVESCAREGKKAQ